MTDEKREKIKRLAFLEQQLIDTSNEIQEIKALLKGIEAPLGTPMLIIDNNKHAENWNVISSLENLHSMLVGPTGIFMDYFHESVMMEARGKIAPNQTCREYTEDVMMVDDTVLNGWPTGFYRDRSNGESQFFIRTLNFYVIVTGLTSNTGAIYVHYLGNGDGFRTLVQEIEDQDLLNLLRKELAIRLSELSQLYFP